MKLTVKTEYEAPPRYAEMMLASFELNKEEVVYKITKRGLALITAPPHTPPS